MTAKTKINLATFKTISMDDLSPTEMLRGPRTFYSYENMSEASISIEHTFQNIPGSANTYKDETLKNQCRL